MSNLYIHIGTHKTGSTAIQSALRYKKNDLKREGIVYLPTFPSIRALQNKKSINDREIKQIRQELISHLGRPGKKEDCSYVLSCEGFSGNPYNGYLNTKLIAQSLKSITDGIDTYIIVYLRRQDDFIQSLYTQQIHEGGSYTFEQFLDRFDDTSFNWYLLLQHYSESFGKNNVIVRRYHKDYLPNANSLIADFGNVINSKSLATYDVIAHPNNGYSRSALEVARLTNPHLTIEEKDKLRFILQQTSSKKPFDDYTFYGAQEREKLLSQHTESNSSVVREYFQDKSPNLFPLPDKKKDVQEYQGLSVEEVAVIAMKGIIFLKQDDSRILRLIIMTERWLILKLSKTPRIKAILTYLGKKMGL